MSPLRDKNLPQIGTKKERISTDVIQVVIVKEVVALSICGKISVTILPQIFRHSQSSLRLKGLSQSGTGSHLSEMYKCTFDTMVFRFVDSML